MFLTETLRLIGQTEIVYFKFIQLLLFLVKSQEVCYGCCFFNQYHQSFSHIQYMIITLALQSVLNLPNCPTYIHDQLYDLPSLHSEIDYQIQKYSQFKLIFNLAGPTATKCNTSKDGELLLQESSLILKYLNNQSCVVLQPYIDFKGCNFSKNSDNSNYELITWMDGIAIQLRCNDIQQAQYQMVQTKQFINFKSQKLCSVTLPRYIKSNTKTVVGIVFMTIGIILLIFGQRYLRISIFLSEIILVFLVVCSIINVRQNNSPWIITIIVSIAAIQASACSLIFPRVGVAFIAMLSALIICFILQAAFLNYTGSLLAFYILLGLIGLIMSSTSLIKIGPWFISTCTSISGAYLTIRPLGYWFGKYPPQFSEALTNYNYYFFLASKIMLIGVGVAIQRYVYRRHKKQIDKGHRILQEPVQFVGGISHFSNAIFQVGKTVRQNVNKSIRIQKPQKNSVVQSRQNKKYNELQMRELPKKYKF